MMKEQFFYLLQKGLGWEGNNMDFRPMSVEEWKGIWHIAQKQTVCGIVFAGIEKLPKEMQPPKNMMIQFWSLTEQIRKANMKMVSAAKEMTEWFENEGLEPVIIKGIAAGALYPNPELRMPGDIDMFFHRDFEKAVPIVKSKGIDVTLDPNHDKFSYKGIPVELHHTAFKSLYPIENTDFSPIPFESESYSGRILNIKATAMLMLMHPAKHFMNEGIGLRQLCDWVMFLKRYEECPETVEAWNEVKRQGAERFAIEFTAIAVHYLGLELKNPEKWIGKSDTRLRDRMMEIIMERGNFAKSCRAKRSTNTFRYFYKLSIHVLSVYPYWKQHFWKNVPKRVGLRISYILKGKPLATR